VAAFVPRKLFNSTRRSFVLRSIRPIARARLSFARGKKPAQKKPLLLMYRGRDLHKAAVLEEFGHEYTNLYLKLFLKRDE